jgi:hypothetical protein
MDWNISHGSSKDAQNCQTEGKKAKLQIANKKRRTKTAETAMQWKTSSNSLALWHWRQYSSHEASLIWKVVQNLSSLTCVFGDYPVHLAECRNGAPR